MIACICGGTIEYLLFVIGLGAIARFFAKRHNKETCKCCKETAKNEPR
jgi:hypothetical protein